MSQHPGGEQGCLSKPGHEDVDAVKSVLDYGGQLKRCHEVDLSASLDALEALGGERPDNHILVDDVAQPQGDISDDIVSLPACFGGGSLRCPPSSRRSPCRGWKT